MWSVRITSKSGGRAGWFGYNAASTSASTVALLWMGVPWWAPKSSGGGRGGGGAEGGNDDDDDDDDSHRNRGAAKGQRE